jgi:hypothetical protein
MQQRRVQARRDHAGACGAQHLHLLPRTISIREGTMSNRLITFAELMADARRFVFREKVLQAIRRIQEAL